MLPKALRLPSPLISRLMRHGKRFSNESFLLTYGHNDQQSVRFAFIVGMRIDKRAVVRNRVKRLLSESVRHLMPGLRLGWDVVVTARKAFEDIPQVDIEKQLKQAF